jgi:hypothetical protein
MNISTANPEVHSYLEAVRAHLADIPERDLEDLVEDLEGHLLEVAAEDDGSLEDRLGPPSVYADELRATAGLPSKDSASEALSRRVVRRFERSSVGRFAEELWRSKSVGALRTFLPELRPGWWVLRGYLAVAAFAIISSEGYYANPVVPFAWGGYAVGVIAVIAAVLCSVALGLAAKTRPTVRRMSLMVSLGAAALTVMAVPRLGDLYVQTTYLTEYVAPAGLYHADERPITNICPYSNDGTPLTGVLLYDQEGRPIVDTVPQADLGPPIQPTPAIANAYPRNLERVDPYTGQRTALTCPAILTVPPLQTPAGQGD